MKNNNIWKGKNLLFMLAIILSGIMPVADFVAFPVMNNFYVDFASHPLLTNYIVSGPTLAMLFASVAAGKLTTIFSNKNILLAGTIMYAIGTIFTVTVYNVYYIAVIRTFLGLSYGFTMVPAYALITDVFMDEKPRSMAVGVYSASQSAWGILLSLIAGFIAVKNWRAVFSIHWVAIIIFAVVIFWIPDVGMNSAPDEAETKKGNFHLISIGGLICSAVLMCILANIYLFYISTIVAERRLGNESLVGILTSCNTIGCLGASICFAVVYEKFKKATNVVSYAFLGCGFLLIYFASGIPMVITGSILVGLGYGLALAYFPMRASVAVPASQVGTSIGIIQAANGAGGFLATYATSATMLVMGTDLVSDILPIVAVAAIIGAVGGILCSISKKNRM